MRFHVGTSGYSYKEWKGSFYPEKMPQSKMLEYYSRQFSAVEINSTFQRLPSDGTVADWLRQTPKAFRFALKAPQTITHRKRLKNVEQATAEFIDTAALLPGRCGPLLFQLPPNFKKDLERLEAFVSSIRDGVRVAFEFRHASWFDEEVVDCLRKHACALCVADIPDAPTADLTRTCNWGYVRLRRKSYTTKKLSEWIARIQSQKWREAYVFFKHEETGTGPKFATRFLKLIEA